MINEEKVTNRFAWTEEAANIILKGIGIAVFAFLSFYAFRYTCDIKPWEDEIPIDYKDSILWNAVGIAFILGLILLLSILEQHLSEKAKRVFIVIILSLSTLLVFVEGMIWLYGANREPQADQLMVYAAAEYFNEGDFSMLGRNCYFGDHPTNLGVTFFVSLIYRIAGPFNYYAVGFVNVLLIAGTVPFGYFISKYISKSFTIQALYCLSMVFCMPYVCYAHYIYGDIPGIFFSFVAFYILLKYLSAPKTRLLIELPIVITLAAMLKGNYAIIAIATFIVAVFEWIRRRKIGLLISGICALLGALFILNVVKFGYEQKSGIAIDNELSRITWISMAFEDIEGRGAGWYNNFPVLMNEMDYDNTEFEEHCRAVLQERLNCFAQNPPYAMDFFKRKILSQWNEPTFEALFFGAKYTDEPTSQIVRDITTEEGYDSVLALMDRLQFIIYFGMLLYCFFFVRKDDSLGKQVLLIAIIGGFLFSMIWESKARYILPYYVMMFPLFACGYKEIMNKCLALFQKHK